MPVRENFSVTIGDFILMLPFALLLGAMALAPIFAPHWWLQHYAKVALGLGAVTAGWYFFALHDTHSLGEAAHEYVSFIALVGSLYVVSGGIHIGVQGESTPLKNVIFLLIGAVLANVLGTTGAAMLLIRPWIRMNKYRITAHHIVFFIFIVANVGGCLTPIGDPPLFLGFLQGIPLFLREILMLAAAAGSYFTTKKSVHAANHFNFHPIQEVAILFAGIFTTMMPALAWLDRGSSALLGQNPSPGIFYWGTGILSSALDNAPTYLGFLRALHGTAGAEDIHSLLTTHAHHILAISIGAVFFGAATYIGNGPNFMVKAIAEQNQVRMPSFVEFILKFSLLFLLPVLIIVWLIFFQG